MISEIVSLSPLQVSALIIKMTEQRNKQTKIQQLRMKKKIFILIRDGKSLSRKIKVTCKSPFQFKL